MLSNPLKWLSDVGSDLPAGAVPLSDDHTGKVLTCLFSVGEGRWREWNTATNTLRILPDTTQVSVIESYQLWICGSNVGEFRITDENFARLIDRPLEVVQGWKSGTLPLSVEDAHHLLRMAADLT